MFTPVINVATKALNGTENVRPAAHGTALRRSLRKLPSVSEAPLRQALLPTFLTISSSLRTSAQTATSAMIQVSES